MDHILCSQKFFQFFSKTFLKYLNGILYKILQKYLQNRQSYSTFSNCEENCGPHPDIRVQFLKIFELSLEHYVQNISMTNLFNFSTLEDMQKEEEEEKKEEEKEEEEEEEEEESWICQSWTRFCSIKMKNKNCIDQILKNLYVIISIVMGLKDPPPYLIVLMKLYSCSVVQWN